MYNLRLKRYSFLWYNNSDNNILKMNYNYVFTFRGGHWSLRFCGFAVLALFFYLGFLEFEILKLGFSVFYSTAI